MLNNPRETSEKEKCLKEFLIKNFDLIIFDMDRNNEIIRAEIERETSSYMEKVEKLQLIAFHAKGAMASIAECRKVSAEVELQRAQLDSQLNALLIKANLDLESKKMFVPIIGSQLDRIQDRIDKFSDKLMDMMDDFSSEGLEKQRILLEFIEGQNDKLQQLSFNLMR